MSKRLHSNYKKNREFTRGLHKAFNMVGIPFYVKSSKSSHLVYVKKYFYLNIIKNVLVTKHLKQGQTYDHNS